MACKVVLFFNQDDQGWTETYYHGASDPKILLNSFSDSFWNKSITFRAVGTQLFSARGTQLNTTQRVSYSLFFQGAHIQGVEGAAGSDPDVTATDALFTLYTSPIGSRKAYYRGLRDSDTLRDANGFSQPTALIARQLNTWIQALSDNKFCIRVGGRPPDLGLVWVNVVQVEPIASGPYSKVTVDAPSGLVAGVSQVQFQGVDKNLLPGFPTKAKVVGVSETSDAHSFTVPYKFRGASNPTFPRANMRACKVAYTYTVIDDWAFEEFHTHKTGRSFGVPRGRSRAAVRAQ